MSRRRTGRKGGTADLPGSTPPAQPVAPIRLGWHRAALAVAAAAVLLAAALSQGLLAGLPRIGDEVSYVLQGRILAAGRLFLPPPAVREAFENDGVILTADRWCGKYPPGHPLLLALGWLAGVPWAVGPLLFGVATYGVFRLGSRLYDAGTGLAGALLFAGLPFAFLQAASFMAHVPSLAWAVWCLVLLADASSGTERADLRLVAAGLAGGMAFLVRPFSALFLLAVPVMLLLRRFRPARAGLRAAAFFTAGGAAPFAFLLWFQWQSYGSPFVSGYAVYDPMDAFLGNRHVTRTLVEVFAANVRWYSVALPDALWLVPGPLLLWLAFVLLKPRQEDLVVASAACGLVAGHLCYYYHDVLYGGPRFAFEATAFLALLLARGIANVLGALSGLRWRPASFIGRRASTLLLVSAALVGAATVSEKWPSIVAHSRTYMGVPNDPMAGAAKAGVGPDALVLVDFEDPIRSLDTSGADSPAFAAYFFRNALDPAAGRQVFARALPFREAELVASYPRAETWRVVVSLSLPRVGEAPMNGPSDLHGLRWSRIR